jgi:hypothetical protein
MLVYFLVEDFAYDNQISEFDVESLVGPSL